MKINILFTSVLSYHLTAALRPHTFTHMNAHTYIYTCHVVIHNGIYHGDISKPFNDIFFVKKLPECKYKGYFYTPNMELCKRNGKS